MMTKTKKLSLLSLLLGFLTLSCAHKEKYISELQYYPAIFLASTDGTTFLPLPEFYRSVDEAKPECRKLNNSQQIRAQYVISKTNHTITVDLKSCSTADQNNETCTVVKKCLQQRKIPWMTRASGRSKNLAGLIYSDWVGKCGGVVTGTFHYTTQAPMPVEKITCNQPLPHALDTDYQMFGLPTSLNEKPKPISTSLELLISKWNQILFSPLDSVPLIE